MRTPPDGWGSGWEEGGYEPFRGVLASHLFFQLFENHRNHFLQIPHNTLIGALEDRCVRVVVDCHDNSGIRNSLQMLFRSGYAAGDVEFALKFLSLHPDKAVHADKFMHLCHRPRGADCGARFLGQGFY